MFKYCTLSHSQDPELVLPKQCFLSDLPTALGGIYGSDRVRSLCKAAIAHRDAWRKEVNADYCYSIAQEVGIELSWGHWNKIRQEKMAALLAAQSQSANSGFGPALMNCEASLEDGGASGSRVAVAVGNKMVRRTTSAVRIRKTLRTPSASASANAVLLKPDSVRPCDAVANVVADASSGV